MYHVFLNTLLNSGFFIFGFEFGIYACVCVCVCVLIIIINLELIDMVFVLWLVKDVLV